MKKILSLLTVLTISGTAIPTTIAASPYQKEEHKIEKRQTPPSLQNIITTVNIGEIEINDQNHIIERLREINHPILSRPEFLENIVLENITLNNAIVYTRTNIQTDYFSIPNSIRFTVNFTAERPLFSTVIINRNLGTIESNTINNILNKVLDLNKNLINSYYLTINKRTSNNSELLLLNSRYNRNHFTFDKPISVTYTAQRYDLSTVILNTELGELPDNNPQTILQRVTELNPSVNINYLQVEEITENSADIFSQNNAIYFGYQTVHFNLQQNSQNSNNEKKKKLNNNISNCQDTTGIIGSVLLGTGSGAAAGAVFGSAIPGLGNVFGLASGALFGGITSLLSIKLICNK